MTLFDDSNTHDSSTATLTEQPSTTDTPAGQAAPAAEIAHEAQAPEAQTEEQKPVEDFASALESFTTEAEEAAGEDHLIHGTVLKITGSYVFVDIGAKSEGALPVAEVLDHDGNPKFQPGDAIEVMREKGHTDEGYINLSFQKAQRLRAWDDIERCYSENQPIKATVVERTKGQVMDLLKQMLRPEFLNRVDDVVMFHPLLKKEIKGIIRIQLDGLQKMVAKNGMNLQFSDYALDYLAENGFDPQFGARPLKRLIQKEIVNQLSKKILAGDVDKDHPVLVDVFDGVVVFRNEMHQTHAI